MGRRRIIAILLTFAMLFAMTACGKDKKDAGEVENAEVSNGQESTKKDRNIFKKQESPFDYKYTSCINEAAQVKFDVPADWEKTVYNSRLIKFDIPETDPVFPNCTLWFMAQFDIVNTTTGYDSVYAEDFGKLFYTEIPTLPFRASDGWEYLLRSYRTPDKIVSNSTIAEPDLIAETITNNVALTRSDTIRRAPAKHSLYTCYAYWQERATMLAMVTPEEVSEDDSRNMLKYIVSSYTYVPQKSGTAKSFKIDGYEMEAPSEFEPLEGSDTMLISPIYNCKGTTGMDVGIFRLPENPKNVDFDTLQKGYVEEMAKKLLQGDISDYRFTCVVGEKGTKTVAGKNAKYYSSLVQIVSIDEVTPDYYGSDQNWRMESYVFDDGNGKTVILSTLYQEGNGEICKKASDMIVNSIKKA